MQFKKMTWDAAEELRSFVPLLTSRECDPTPGCLLMWRDACRMDYCVEDASLFVCLHDEQGIPHHALPVSRDHGAALEKLVRECKGNGPMYFTTIPEAHVPMFRQLFPDCQVFEQREYADYLYRAETLVTMAGRKLSGQRNQMSQFRRNHPDWRFEPVTEGNLPSVIDFLTDHFLNDPSIDPVKKQEDRMSLDVLQHLDAHPLSGGVLTADGRVYGFSFGERIDDTLHVHMEKALREEKGAYQMVVNQFSALYAADGVEWINREDDNGDPGLRKAKLAYLPEKLLNKVRIVLP